MRLFFDGRIVIVVGFRGVLRNDNPAERPAHARAATFARLLQRLKVKARTTAGKMKDCFLIRGIRNGLARWLCGKSIQGSGSPNNSSRYSYKSLRWAPSVAFVMIGRYCQYPRFVDLPTPKWRGLKKNVESS